MSILRRCLLVPFTICSALAAEKVDFGRDVLPIFSANCFACHGRDPETRKAKLRLDLRDSALTDRHGFTPIVPGRAAASELIARITSSDVDEVMPPPDHGRKLNPTEIRVLRDWIDQGAEYTEHWAFVPPVRTPPPAVQDDTWPQSPVDRFVLAHLEKEKLRPAGPASRQTLIRRASLDLTGLVPTPADIEAFVADRSPEAYARLIDRLLASPHYGERYGRHWLDVARYADSGGFETDIFFGHAWRYRDYVIRAFNSDKPFDRFIREQIAGDELFPGDAEAWLATGLYTTGPVLQEAGMVKGKLEYDQHTDFADTTGAAFLGLTVGCARCHDHKYDPLSQKEYFALQAVFAASDQFDFSVDGKKLRDRAALKNTQKEFETEQARTRAQRETDPVRLAELLRKTGDAYIEADAALKARVDNSRRYDSIRRAVARFHHHAGTADAGDPLAEEDGDDNTAIALKAQLRGVLHGAPAEKTETALLNIGVVALLNPLQTPRGQRRPATPEASQTPGAAPAPVDYGLGGRRAFNALATDEARRSFLIDLGRLQIDRPPPDGYIADLDALRHDLGRDNLAAPSSIPIRVLAHRETPHDIHLLHRGELDHPREIVPPGLPEKLAPPATLAAVASAAPDRRRAALAEWIASDQNLLTARVIANRVWQWHFGEGLVRTPNDFGIRGDRPTHPELLDWLATELIAHGWSLKHLHRVIMKSAAYQMAAAADAATLSRDPDNRLLTRFQPHRLQAEIIWDGIRSAAGTLDLTLFGLPIAPPLDDQEQLGNYRKWPASTPAESNRRAIYLLVKRSFRFPMLSAFDLPDNITSCGRRDITTIPNQALTLLNNRTMREQASAFGTRLLRETKNNLDAVPARAWPIVYARPISDEELASAGAFLRARAVDPQAAVADLCLALFNTNEFIYQQ